MAEKEYIEREAAMLQINAADFVRDDKFEGGATLLFCDDVVDRLFAIPAADVRPVVRGKWLPDYDYTEYDYDGSTPLPEPQKFQDGWQCSLCGAYEPSTVNFCPNCGADMREES